MHYVFKFLLSLYIMNIKYKDNKIYRDISSFLSWDSGRCLKYSVYTKQYKIIDTRCFLTNLSSKVTCLVRDRELFSKGAPFSAKLLRSLRQESVEGMEESKKRGWLARRLPRDAIYPVALDSK